MLSILACYHSDDLNTSNFSLFVTEMVMFVSAYVGLNQRNGTFHKKHLSKCRTINGTKNESSEIYKKN